MELVIFFALLCNLVFIGLVILTHKHGAKAILACGLFFLLLTLTLLTTIFIRTYYFDVPKGLSENLFDETNEKIEWLIAIFGFVPAAFTGNLISKGLDGLFKK